MLLKKCRIHPQTDLHRTLAQNMTVSIVVWEKGKNGNETVHRLLMCTAKSTILKNFSNLKYILALKFRRQKLPAKIMDKAKHIMMT